MCRSSSGTIVNDGKGEEAGRIQGRRKSMHVRRYGDKENQSTYGMVGRPIWLTLDIRR